MDLSALLVQLLNGMAGASSLFLVAAGLSLVFGVTRIVNFAHGSFYMLGLYTAYALVQGFGPAIGFWPSVMLAAALVGLLGAVVELAILRRIYKAPELFQLLATFALVLVFKDAALWLWGPEDLLGPRAPGLAGAVSIGARAFPSYDLFLIAAGPLVLGLMWLLLHRTRWGTLVRAASLDREMLAALGVNQAWLFTGVFAFGSMLAGLGGALQLPREAASLAMDTQVIADAFVVVVVGGLGSLPGAYLAAVLIGQLKALCIALGTVQLLGLDLAFSSLTLVLEFAVMALVLVLRPWGLMGRAQPMVRGARSPEPLLQRASPRQSRAALAILAALASMGFVLEQQPYLGVLVIDLLTAALLAASLHFIMGPAGMHSFGHAAYFGVGAYAGALLLRSAHWPMEATLLGGPLVAAATAALTGWFCVRLAGVYFAMLTLAFSQLLWSVVYQWDFFTGGSNGLNGVWPAPWLAGRQAYYLLTLALVVCSVLALRRIIFSPFGYAMRGARDAPMRAEASGIDVERVQWLAFVIAAFFAGLAGVLFAFSKGSIGPDSLGMGRSVDALVMVLLGGIHTLTGPLVGAFSFGWLQDSVARNTGYWRACLGAIMLLLVLAFPQGIAGFSAQALGTLRGRR